MTPDSMRIALVAPLIAPLREPQLGGVQTFLVDLARGLAGRGHEVTVFAARGSRVEGVRVMDTGVDAALLDGTLFRPGREPTDDAPSDAAFAATLALVGSFDFDVVHNHAFDVPAIRHAASLATPVLHSLHMPVDPRIGAALAAARRSAHPPLVAAVSAAQAGSWRRLASIDGVLRPGIPTATIPWRATRASTRLLFAGRFSPEKGALEAVAIAGRLEGAFSSAVPRTIPVADRVHALVEGSPWRSCSPWREDPVDGDGGFRRRALPGPMGRALRPGGGGGQCLRDPGGGLPPGRPARRSSPRG